MLHLLEALPVECRASDIIDAIEVDLSSLTEIDSMLHARDIKLPAGYKLAVDADDAIVKLTPPRVEAPEAEAGHCRSRDDNAYQPISMTSRMRYLYRVRPSGNIPRHL